MAGEVRHLIGRNGRYHARLGVPKDLPCRDRPRRADRDTRSRSRLMAELAQGPGYETGAETSLHADDAWRQLLERAGECQPLDLAAERDLAVDVEADEMEDLLCRCRCRFEARGRVTLSMGCVSG